MEEMVDSMVKADWALWGITAGITGLIEPRAGWLATAIFSALILFYS